MRYRIIFGIFVSFMISLTAFGQGITVSGAGYATSTAIRVAPGQITTLFVSGMKTVLSQAVNATSLPLPTTLAGISITLHQTGSQPISVPLLSIHQSSVCSNDDTPSPPGTTADCLMTAITVQIPFELTGPGVGTPASTPTPPSTPTLVVTENGGVSKAFSVYPVPDNLHVVNICDDFPSVAVASAARSCGPLVTHADGTLVGADVPAQPGEEIVIWAYGLGQTLPAAKTGQLSPSTAAPLSSPIYLQFDFSTNAMPSPPFINRFAATTGPVPIFVGLTPQQVGVYQINVRIPNSIPAVNTCGPACSHVACTIYNTVTSNLTIRIGANLSWDGAAICVQPPQ